LQGAADKYLVLRKDHPMRRQLNHLRGHAWSLENRCVPAAFVVDTNQDTDDANPGNGQALDDNGKTSFRAAVQEANALLANSGGFDRIHTITFTDAMTITLMSSMDPFGADINVNQARAILEDGPPPAPVVIQGDGTFSLFTIEQYSLSGFSGPFQITGGNAVFDRGGAFRVEGDLSLGNCDIFGNSARFGGAISVSDTGYLYVSDCQIHSNNATLDGGAIESYGSVDVISGTEIYDNTATEGNGGGIFCGAGWVSLSGNSEIYANTAKLNGGGVYNKGDFTMSGGKIYLNQALGMTVEGNLTGGLGGGIFNGKLGNTGGSVELSGVTIDRNSAAGKGGAMYLAANTTTSITNCTIQQNTAAMGAIGIAYEVGAAPGITGGMIDAGQEPVQV
jgi:hypothetical protein